MDTVLLLAGLHHCEHDAGETADTVWVEGGQEDVGDFVETDLVFRTQPLHAIPRIEQVPLTVKEQQE